jgi:hypothetical protein
MTRLASIWEHAASARGSALVAVILTLLVVAAITGGLITQTRTDLILSRTLELGIENELLAEGGIAFAILNLSDPDNNAPFIPDGRIFSVTVDGKGLSLQVQSEAGKINLNQSPNPLLNRLLRACGGEGQQDIESQSTHRCRGIELLGNRGDIVLDSFLGSGTTLLAAERTGRICHAIELDPLYVDTAIRRWQNLTGRDARRTTDNKSFKEIEAEAELANGQ